MSYPRSEQSVLLVEPTLGFNSAQPETDLQLGQTPSMQNFEMREGALEPRSRLSTVNSNPRPMAAAVTGGMEAVSSLGSVYPVISGSTQWAWYSAGSWSRLSYVGSFVPTGTETDYFDFTQIYYPTTDEMLVVAGCESHQSLFCWGLNSAVFSTLTGAPRGRYITAFDNFLLALNIRDVGSAQSRYVQRVQWSDRGNPSNWTSIIAGFEDLLGARGEGTRIMDLDNRVIIFFEGEIWVGIRSTGAASFPFEPLDRTTGTRYSWTVAKTPIGLVFLGNDFMVYLLPKEGGPAQPIGKALQRRIRETIDAPTRAHAVYDEAKGLYRLFYPIRGGTGLPTAEVQINLTEGSFALQTYALAQGTRSLTRGFGAYLQSSTTAISWDELTTAGYTWDTLPYTWDAMGSSSTRVNRTVFLGSSNGTMYHCSSLYSLEDGTAVEAIWRSGAFGGSEPDRWKCLNQVRVDCSSAPMSHLTIRVSRDQGTTFDMGQNLTIPNSSNQTQVTAWVQTTSRYPMVELSTEDIGNRIYRMWVALRTGGQ
jgi:hypothetical protein